MAMVWAKPTGSVALNRPAISSLRQRRIVDHDPGIAVTGEFRRRLGQGLALEGDLAVLPGHLAVQLGHRDRPRRDRRISSSGATAMLLAEMRTGLRLAAGLNTSTMPSRTRTWTGAASSRRTVKLVPTTRTLVSPAATTKGRALFLATSNSASPCTSSTAAQRRRNN